jgi:murein DD-endopeptidase MepM/ murein hydrolase activator NlpD
VLGSRTGYVENTIYAGGDVYGVVSGNWQYPFKGGYVKTSDFGWRQLDGVDGYHKGVDLVGVNKHIYPINNGTVVTVGYDSGGYGNYVIISHGDDYWSLYAHMKQVYVGKGQTVNKNTILGVEGSTGRSTGSHLHLEIRKGSNSSSNVINPITFLNSN